MSADLTTGRGDTGRWLPPKLRRQIAIASHPSVLPQLCVADRLWNAECEPVLYERVGLFLGLNQKQVDRTVSCMVTLVMSPYKASLVRTLLVHFSRGRDVSESVWQAASAVAKSLFSDNFLPRLVNLVDLRVRNGNLAAVVIEGLANILGRPDPVVKLQHLHIPHAYGGYPGDMARILRAQRGTLRTLGVQTVWKSEDWTWPLRTGLLDEGCAVFGFSNNVYDAPFDWLALHDTRHVDAIAQTLHEDQLVLIPRPIPWYYGFFIIALDLRRHGIPSHDAVRQLARAFPYVAFLDITLAQLPDPAVLARALSPMTNLRNLHMAASEDAESKLVLDEAQRAGLANAAVAAGCKELSHVTFPDESIRCKSDEDDTWFDPDVPDSDEEADEDEDEDEDE